MPPGSQDAQSDKMIEIPAKLDGLKVTEHVTELFQDVAKREMVMSSVVTIAGDAIVWKIRHHWEVHTLAVSVLLIQLHVTHFSCLQV